MITATKMVVCSFCGDSKKRSVVSVENGKHYYIDPSTNLKWQGKTCPECVELEANYVEPVEQLTTRKCRDCKCFLTVSRYFKCLGCQPELPSIDEEMIYDSEGIDEFTETVAEVFGGDTRENFKSKETKQELNVAKPWTST